MKRRISPQATGESNRILVENMCQPLKLSDEILMKIKQLFLKDIKRGLGRNTHSKAVVKCFLTYVQNLPSGCERGRCLALDVGGSAFTIMLIDLKGHLKHKYQERHFDYPTEILRGTGRNFFDYIAECLSSFVREFHLHLEELPLAFTIAFPIKQYGLHKGLLVAWGKNFTYTDLVGSDVVELLQSAIERRKEIRISTIVLMNDTTALLMSCAFKNHYCKIGMIIDNGCNASYVEQIKYIGTIRQFLTVPALPLMIVNTEWAYFGDNGTLDFLQTDWDKRVRELTPTLHTRIFEKMTSGLYLGPIVREILLEAIKTYGLLQGLITQQLEEPNSFKTSYVYDILTQAKGHNFSTKEVLQRLGYRTTSRADLENVRYICNMVATRSAYLIAATLSCLIDRVGDPYVVVGIDGILVRSFPQYQTIIYEKLKNLVLPEHKFDLVIPDGTEGYGAALVALHAAHQLGLEKYGNKLTFLATGVIRESSVRIVVPTEQRKPLKSINAPKKKIFKKKN